MNCYDDMLYTLAEYANSNVGEKQDKLMDKYRRIKKRVQEKSISLSHLSSEVGGMTHPLHVALFTGHTSSIVQSRSKHKCS